MTTTAAARPVGKLSPGRVYRGRGQWSFILHRVTGVAILGFLFLHIAGEAFIGVSPEAFDTIEDIYKNFFFRLSEIGLLFALAYHAVNGLRITAIDFVPRLCNRQNQLTVVQWIVTLSIFLPGAGVMLAHYFNR